MRLVQLKMGDMRRVAIVEEPELCLIDDFDSVYALALAAIQSGGDLTAMAQAHRGSERLEYDRVCRGDGEWELVAPVDHPGDPSRCLVSGTGLTHFGSARERQSMHSAVEAQETDSMKMFRWGVEGGKPAANAVGIAPEWFYKGNGTIVQAPGNVLKVPSFAEDGGEEAEMAVAYVIGPEGQPYRIGMMPGNEFSDHLFEKKNYLNLAGSKLRTCSIGPELTVNPNFESVQGQVTIRRNGEILWSQPIRTGEKEMCHSLRNLEHHHFKFPLHRRPGDLHIHFLGAYALSFGQGIRLQDGDVMEVQFEGFGRPLRNLVEVIRSAGSPVEVRALL